ncbi:hypothetical protein EK21DRAFT_95242 [Setomelanomma holmii]|uniref:Uncharacterized protein n=1 Tax=Setomelanomma holmii TaxID=210430 RepID=A0A9P4GW29_9PLEO|nr:hypothetical protein EK21DRAFT_95242 [Setomelanomma holmii]
MRSEIFDIVGCDQRIGFWRSDVSQHGDIVQIVTRALSGDLVEYPLPEQKSERGGGGLFCSSRNYIQILQDLILPEPKILSKDSLDILFASQFEDPSPALDQLRASTPMFSAMTGPLTASLPPSGTNHALGGILVMENSELGETRGTMAWGGAYSPL